MKRKSIFDVPVTYTEKRLTKQARKEGLNQGLNQGLSQGLSQGLNQGLSQGINQGLNQGQLQVLEDLLSTKFGAAFERYREVLRQMSVDERSHLTAKVILQADRVDQLFQDQRKAS